jgi:natural product precursor
MKKLKLMQLNVQEMNIAEMKNYIGGQNNTRLFS